MFIKKLKKKITIPEGKWFLFLFHPVNLETGECKFNYYWIESEDDYPRILIENNIQTIKKLLFDEQGKIFVLVY